MHLGPAANTNDPNKFSYVIVDSVRNIEDRAKYIEVSTPPLVCHENLECFQLCVSGHGEGRNRINSNLE